MQDYEFELKVAWIFHQADYSELRKAEGCENLGDLPTTEEDKNNAVIAAKKFGIMDENIHFWTGKNRKEIESDLRK